MSKDKRKNKNSLEKACDAIMESYKKPKGAKGHKTIKKERNNKLWAAGLRPHMTLN